MVQQQLEVIQEIQTDKFWQDVTAPILENVRKRLRLLVKLIEKSKRLAVYTDFQDTIGDEETRELPGFGAGADFEKSRAKATQFQCSATRGKTTMIVVGFSPILQRDQDTGRSVIMGRVLVGVGLNVGESSVAFGPDTKW